MGKPYQDLQTMLIHAGEPQEKIEGAVSMPVFQSATFTYTGQGSYDDLKYIRLNNTPNHLALHAKLAAIEEGEAAIVTASGMAAITTSLLTFLKAGDHLLIQDCLYGGTHSFLTNDLPPFDISFDFIDGNDPESWKAQIRPETRVIYVETMTNPLLEVPDLQSVARFAREHHLVSMIDNTFASPVNFRPLSLGFDLSIHSCTKYLNGHSDIVAGCAIGKEAQIGAIVRKLNHLGDSLDPHACFLLHRGMKTLALRVRQQNENTIRLAQFLEAQPIVEKVNYAGLKSHPQYDRGRELFEGCGGVLSFEMSGGVEQADKLISRLKLPISAPSLGGVETLITRPATTSHSGLIPKDRARLGISDRLIRVAVGVESPEDLCADFEQGLKGL